MKAIVEKASRPSWAAHDEAPRTTLVIPCYNEEARLRPDAFAAFFQTCPAHLTFVDDGSKDRTVEVLQTICARFPQCASLIQLPQNAGKAEAVRQGVLAALDAGASFVGFWDADLATPLDSFHLFLAEFDNRPDLEMVMGARVSMLGRAIERRPVRHYAGRCFATIVSMILELPVYDTQCGAKLFRNTPTVRSAFDTPFLSHWIFDVEVLARLTLQLLRTGGPSPDLCIRELPLPAWKDVEGSKIGPRDAGRVAADLWRIRRWLERAKAAVRAHSRADQLRRTIDSRAPAFEQVGMNTAPRPGTTDSLPHRSS